MKEVRKEGEKEKEMKGKDRKYTHNKRTKNPRLYGLDWVKGDLTPRTWNCSKVLVLLEKMQCKFLKPTEVNR